MIQHSSYSVKDNNNSLPSVNRRSINDLLIGKQPHTLGMDAVEEVHAFLLRNNVSGEGKRCEKWFMRRF